MILKFIKRLILVAFSLVSISTHGYAESKHKLHATSDIYSDLGNDAYAIKLIDAWLRLYQSRDNSIEEEDKEAIAWWTEQEKLNPAMVARMGIEILKREKDMDCKAYMIGEISGLSNTDKAPLVEEIRHQIQQLPRKEDGGIRSDGLEVLEMSAMVLARFGEASDKQLLLSLLRDCPDTFKNRMNESIRKLDERQAKQATNSRPPKSRSGQLGSASASEHSKPDGNEVFSSNRLAWMIGSGLFLLGGILLSRKTVAYLKRK